jgi:hypothetical protein
MQHFRFKHIKDNIYAITNDYYDIYYDLLNNGYEVNCICNYLQSYNNLNKWLNTDYYKQLEYNITQEYKQNLIWENEYGTFIHKYLLFDFGKYINKNNAWKLMDLNLSCNDECVDRIRESYHISENYYLDKLKQFNFFM